MTTLIKKYLFDAMNTAKTCRGCSASLPLSDFYKHAQMADGHLNFCVKCVKARVSKHREQHGERIRAYDRERAKRPHRKAQLRSLIERHQQDPQRRIAHQMTSNAIRDGKLTRPDTCSTCGKQCKPEGHHDDYSKPLEVRWLCRSCHCRHHRLEQLAAQRQLEAV
jgi:hypothetical protein